MEKTTKRYRYIISGTCVLMFSGIVYAWSVLSMPIAEEFPDWSKTQLSFTFTLTMIMFCIGCMTGGMLANRIQAKVYLVVAGILFFTGFLISSQIQSMGMLYLGFGILSGIASGLSYNAVMGTVLQWFPDKSGMISGILLMGFGIGSFIIGKVYQVFTLTETGGWRNSFKILAIVLGVVMLVSSFFIRKPESGEVNFIEETEIKETRGFRGLELKSSEMIKRPAFWKYYCWAVFFSMAGLVLVSQAGGIAKEAIPDINGGVLATIVGLISVFNGIGRVCFGILFDKKGYRVTLFTDIILFFIVEGILILAINSQNFTLLSAGFMAGGFAYGAVTPMNSAVIRQFYGAKHYAMNFSVINTNLIFASFASTIAGSLYDRNGTFISSIIMMCVVSVFGLVAFIGIKEP